LCVDPHALQIPEHYLIPRIAGQIQRLGAQVRVAVNFRWEDQRTGQTILREVGLSQTGEALPGRGETPEGAAATEALEDLAEQIVEKLASSW